MERVAEFVIERGGRRSTVTLSPSGPAPLMPPDTDRELVARQRVGGHAGLGAEPNAALASPRSLATSTGSSISLSSHLVYVQYNKVGTRRVRASPTSPAGFWRLLDTADVRPPGAGSPAQPRRKWHPQPPLLLSLIKARKLDGPGKLFVAHRAQHFLRGPVPGQRAGALYRRRVRGGAIGWESELVWRLAEDHPAPQRHHRPGLHSVVAGG